MSGILRPLLHVADELSRPECVLEREGADIQILDCGVDGEDAARGERLAFAVVGHLHRVADAVGDLVLPSEHVDDRLLEEVARGVVHVLRGLAAAYVADEVVTRLRDDGAPHERAGLRCVAHLSDRRRLSRLLGELHELGELCVADFKCHIRFSG